MWPAVYSNMDMTWCAKLCLTVQLSAVILASDITLKINDISCRVQRTLVSVQLFLPCLTFYWHYWYAEEIMVCSVSFQYTILYRFFSKLVWHSDWLAKWKQTKQESNVVLHCEAVCVLQSSVSCLVDAQLEIKLSVLGQLFRLEMKVQVSMWNVERRKLRR